MDSSIDQFTVERRERSGVAVVVLRDLRIGSEAHVVPSLGDACVRFCLEVGDESWQVLAEPPTDAAFREQTTRYGIPILYPWPNRIRRGRFTFRGRAYSAPPNSPGGHANHGLVRTREWQVEAVGRDPLGAFIRAAVTVGDEPGIPFPFPSRLEVEHRLHGRRLELVARATNLGDGPMPMGFGLHPWFGVPLRPAGARARCELSIPANAYWELEQLLPTGRVLPVTGPLDLRTWRPLGRDVFDHVFTDLEHDGEWFTAALRDPTARRTIVLRSDRAFREHVLYAPAERPVVCLEPYTCPTDAFNLEAGGVSAGVVVLQPGQSWRGRAVIEARIDVAWDGAGER